MEKKKFFTKEEIIEDLIIYLEEKPSVYGADLHGEVFNTDYYIIGTYIAKQALEEYGVFEAIEKIQEYEQWNFGEIYTQLSDPEKVANMLYYILADEYLNNEIGDEIKEILDEKWNEKLSEEDMDKLVELLKQELNLLNAK